MSQPTYLERLALDLIIGLSHVPEECRARHAGYLAAAQNADGGFSGREGPSDLYYTGFALRGLAVLGELSPQTCDRAAGYLRECLSHRASVVDFFSLLYSCGLVAISGGPDVLAETPPGWQNRTAAELETFRTPDGGYNKTPGGSAGSTYHSFLVVLCHELIERPLPAPERLKTFIRSRQRDDGGFVEIGPMKRSGANPTSAAVATLRILDDEVADPRIIDFLLGLVSAEGGIRANTRIPLADLLSTFTGLWTLKELGAFDQIDRSAALRYVQQLKDPAGGFRAGLWDERADAEYTFYGLGSLALLFSPA